MDGRFKFDLAAHFGWIDGQPAMSVTDILRHHGFIDPTWYTEESRSRGTVVHAVTAGLDQGMTFNWADLDPKLHGYVKSWLAFKAKTPIEILDVETTAYHPLYLFWGTRDIRFMLNGHEYLADKKTGAAPYWACWQTAAYDLLAGPTANGKPRKRASIQLYEDGSQARMVEYNGPDHYHDGAEFIAFTITARRQKQYGIGN